MDPLLILINSLIFLNGKASIYILVTSETCYKSIDTHDCETSLLYIVSLVTLDDQQNAIQKSKPLM